MGTMCSMVENKKKKKINISKSDVNQKNQEIENISETKGKPENKTFIKKNNSLKKAKTKGEETTKNNNSKKNNVNDEEKGANNNKFNNNKNEENTKKNNQKKLSRSNMFKSYMPSSNNIYLVCPKCKLLFPSIEKFSFKNKKKDFEILYRCKCSKELNKSYLLDFINPNKPFELNEEFNKFKEANNLIKKAKEKKEFEGSQMIESAIRCSLDINEPPPPPVNVKGSVIDSLLIGSIFPKIKISMLNPINPIKEEEEEKEKEDLIEENKKNKKYEITVSKSFPKSIKVEEYKCTKTFQKNARISVLIQLNSGDLASGSYDCKICIWDLNEASGINYKKEFQEKGTPLCLLEFKPGYLLAGTNDNYISLWNLNSVQSDKIEHKFSGHKLWVNSLAKCNDKIFASCSNDKSIIIWDYDEKKEISRIENAHDDCILTLICLKNGNLCSGAADLLVKVWNWNDGICIFKYEGFDYWIRDLCQFDNNTLLICHGKQIQIWKNLRPIAILNEHEHDVRDICVINKDYFASSSFDNTIKIWNINTKICEQTLKGHTSNVIDIIKLKGSDSLASSSCDETIKIWTIN